MMLLSRRETSVPRPPLSTPRSATKRHGRCFRRQLERDAIRNFNADGFDSLYSRYRIGYPLKFTPEFPVAEVPYL
jgi:hypothetical protein